MERGNFLRRGQRRNLRQCPLDGRGEALGFGRGLGWVALGKAGHHLIRKEFQRGADVCVAVVARLLHKDHLIHAHRLKHLQMGLHLFRVADPAGGRVFFGRVFLEILPQIEFSWGVGLPVM